MEDAVLSALCFMSPGQSAKLSLPDLPDSPSFFLALTSVADVRRRQIVGQRQPKLNLRMILKPANACARRRMGHVFVSPTLFSLCLYTSDIQLSLLLCMQYLPCVVASRQVVGEHRLLCSLR